MSFRSVLLITALLLAPCATAAEAQSVATDVVYGHKDGLALTFDVYSPAAPNGAGVISIISGGWRSRWDSFQQYVDTRDGLRPMTGSEITEVGGNLVSRGYASLLEKGFTVFAVRHGSSPRYAMAEIVGDLRRAVRFIRYHANDYGVDAERLGVWGGSAGGHLALLLGATANAGDPDAEEAFLRESTRLGAVVAYYPPTDLQRFGTPERKERWPAIALEPQFAREFSPILHISHEDAPALILHGDADSVVPILEGETITRPY